MSLDTHCGVPAELPYQPLGFTPYEIDEDGKRDHDRALDAVEDAFNRYEGEMPPHVRRVGQLALYAEVTKQALRNDTHKARLDRPYSPENVVAFVAQSEGIFTGEVARYTDIDQIDADQRIHGPVLRSLRDSILLDTVELDEAPYFKRKPAFESEEVFGVEVKQHRMQHLRGRFMTATRLLLLVDMLDEENTTEGDMSKLEPIMLDYVAGQTEKPRWLWKAVSTYYVYDIPGTKEMKDKHRDVSPNLPVWQRPTIVPKPVMRSVGV